MRRGGNRSGSRQSTPLARLNILYIYSGRDGGSVIDDYIDLPPRLEGCVDHSRNVDLARNICLHCKCLASQLTNLLCKLLNLIAGPRRRSRLPHASSGLVRSVGGVAEPVRSHRPEARPCSPGSIGRRVGQWLCSGVVSPESPVSAQVAPLGQPICAGRPHNCHNRCSPLNSPGCAGLIQTVNPGGVDSGDLGFSATLP